MSWQADREVRRKNRGVREGAVVTEDKEVLQERENLIGSDDVKKIIKSRCQKMYIHYRDMEVPGEYCCFQAVTV